MIKQAWVRSQKGGFPFVLDRPSPKLLIFNKLLLGSNKITARLAVILLKINAKGSGENAAD